MTALMELWKYIEGYENIYSVSNLGGVRSEDRLDSANHRLKGRTMKLSSDREGYKVVTLTSQGKPRMFKVHRLAALAFIANPENKPQVNHIDGCKFNNSLDNLEWVTNSDNQNHAVKNNLIRHTQGEGVWCSKLVAENIPEIFKLQREGYTHKAIGTIYNVNRGTIGDVLNKRTWKQVDNLSNIS